MYVGIKFELQVIEMYDWGDAFEKMTPDIEVIYAFRQKGLPRCVNRNLLVQSPIGIGRLHQYFLGFTLKISIQNANFHLARKRARYSNG